MIKKGIYITMSIVLMSCNFNTIHKNEESEKEKAEEVLNRFYQLIENGEYDETTSFLSPNFYKYTSKEDYLEFIKGVNNEFGTYKSRDLINWSTLRIEGDNPKNVINKT